MTESDTKKQNLIDRYVKLSAVHNYIYGFIYAGVVYAYTTETVEAILDKSSSKNGGGCSLRYRPTAAQKLEIISRSDTVMLATEDEFNEEVKKLKFKRPNRGDTFEKMIVEKAGGDWKKLAIPFTEKGDAKIFGIDYQIKFEKATFASENEIAKFEKAKEEKEKEKG